MIIDPLAMSVGADPQAARVVLETIRLVRSELGNNLTLGASNISFGLPGRASLNATFLAMATQAGLTSAIANPLTESVRTSILATDVLMARDTFARAWIGTTAGRKRRRLTAGTTSPLEERSRVGWIARADRAADRGRALG